MTVIFNLQIFAQQEIIIDEYGNDTIHYYEGESRLGNIIKVNAFPDGSYIFYRDSSKIDTAFTGEIANGLTYGDYFYCSCYSEDADCIGRKKIHSEKSKLNGIYSYCRHNYSLPNSIFVNNNIMEIITIINPFNVFNYIDVHPDSFSFFLKEGRIDSVQYYSPHTFPDSLSAQIQFFFKDKSDTINHKNEPFYKTLSLDIMTNDTFYRIQSVGIEINYDTLHHMRHLKFNNNYNYCPDIFWFNEREEITSIDKFEGDAFFDENMNEEHKCFGISMKISRNKGNFYYYFIQEEINNLNEIYLNNKQ